MKKFFGRTAALFAAACFFTVGAAYASGKGDVNGDGSCDKGDLEAMSRFLLGEATQPMLPDEADLSGDGRVDAFDLCLLRKAAVRFQSADRNIVRVTNTEEFKAALADAKPGDEIVLAPGEYVYSGSTPKGRMFTGSAEGTEDMPIIIRSEDPVSPSIISGINVEGSYALTILGDWWEIRDVKVTTAAKGIIVDNGDHTKIINCEVYNIGQEGIHLRDDSSDCLVEDCYIHDTGLYTPKYGEGVYIGSAKSTTGYGYKCDNNVIRSCRFGPNIAAEHIDVKEYTTGTLIEYCTFDGTGMSGENYADSFVDLKGNDCILRYCTGYRNGAVNINRAFEANKMDEGWGQNNFIYGNKAYMDTSINSLGKKMVMVNAWDCTVTVWDNYMAYEDGELFSCDDEADRWKYYNCSDLTYGGQDTELP